VYTAGHKVDGRTVVAQGSALQAPSEEGKPFAQREPQNTAVAK